MKFLFRLASLVVLTGCILFAQEHPNGVHPRATPDDYAVKASGQGKTFAASLVPVEQAKRLFVADITGKYLVFEIACFPGADGAIPVDPDEFVIIQDKGGQIHRSDPAAVAAAVQKQRTPSPGAQNTDVSTEGTIGYESGVDPVTGRRVSGVYGGGGVGVAHGGPRGRDYPPPGATSEDRVMLASQLRERSLPPGQTARPVAGYVYFPRDLVKKDHNGNYLLRHLDESSANGTASSQDLLIPAKTH